MTAVTAPHAISISSPTPHASLPLSASVSHIHHLHAQYPSASSVRVHTPTSPASSSSSILNKPSFLEHSNYRFVILDAPTNSNLPSYLEYFRKKNVVAIARACEPTYDSRRLTDAGIRVLDVPFADGAAPNAEVIAKWLALVTEVLGPPVKAKKAGGSKADSREGKGGDEEKKVAEDKVHVGGGNGGMTSSFSSSSIGPSASALSPSAPVIPSSPRPGHSHGHVHGPSIGVHCVAGLGRAPVLVCIALMHSGMSAHDAVHLVRKKRRGAINAKQLEFLERYEPATPPACCCIQ